MKLVREHINEKFTEKGDPIHDLGIGLSKFIKELPKKMFLEDYKYNYIPNAGKGHIFWIDIIKEKRIYNVNYYSNDLIDPHTNKSISHIEYTKKLLKQLNVEDCFEKNIKMDRNLPWHIYLNIKPEYIKYFPESKAFYREQYIN